MKVGCKIVLKRKCVYRTSRPNEVGCGFILEQSYLIETNAVLDGIDRQCQY